MKHTIEALQQLKEKIQPEHYTLLCNALIKDTDEEIAKLKAQLPAKATNSPAPCDRKAIWQNVAIKCDTQEQQEHLAQMSYSDGIDIDSHFLPYQHDFCKYISLAPNGKLNNYSSSYSNGNIYTYESFIVHYNRNQCKGQ